MTGHYEQVARSIGQLVDEKQQLYGDSFGAAPAILCILYPDGVKPEQYESLLTMVRVLDKLKRIATDNDSDGEDPWRDVGGYAVLEVGRREKERPATRSWAEVEGRRLRYHPIMQAASDDLARKMNEAVRQAFADDIDRTVASRQRGEYDDGS